MTAALDEVPPMASPEGDSAYKTDRHAAIRQAVLALPPRYRAAIVLFYFHEMDISAAARSLGLPVGTVKSPALTGKENPATTSFRSSLTNWV
jgi:DNA-directed RNA polymerase specialized sigma24 family protein